MEHYAEHARRSLDVLIEHGTDTYGTLHTPLLCSILDVDLLRSPSDPLPLDEYFRVIRRGRRSPGGSNLMGDQPLLRAMYRLSEMTGDSRYATFADHYAAYVMEHLVDDKGFFWWGWHRHYDVHRDICDGHNDNPHEIHTHFEICWDRLWALNPDAVQREIEAIWQWHVVDKQSGEINRHGDGTHGCDFSMSAGAHIQAFAFLHSRTGEHQWIDRARRLADYFWVRRNPQTGLFPERPNAGPNRFDGSTFATSNVGLHAYSLLKAWQTTSDNTFRDYALAYLNAYAEYGYDEGAGCFHGALRLDGSPIEGPRIYTDDIDSTEGYLACQPRGTLDIWQPYVAGYEHPLATAQTYAYAYALTGDESVRNVARLFADWIDRVPPGSSMHPGAWYRDYSITAGQQGTYAEHYGRVISFRLALAHATGSDKDLVSARGYAEQAIAKLQHPSGLFRGHPAKPYYENMDGVGHLILALLQLSCMLEDPTALSPHDLTNT